MAGNQAPRKQESAGSGGMFREADGYTGAMTSQQPPPWLAAQSAAADAQHAYNWEHAQSPRGRWSEPVQCARCRRTASRRSCSPADSRPAFAPIDDLIACNEVVRAAKVSSPCSTVARRVRGLRAWPLKTSTAVAGTRSGELRGDDRLLRRARESLRGAARPGDVAIIERPTYPGSTRLIMSCLARIEGVSVDDDGLDCEELEG
jgi:hypothetical protein